MAEQKLIYSQHLRCLARLLKNTAQTAVFTYLFDEYLLLLRQGISNPGFIVSNSQIAENTGVDRSRVGIYLQKLEELGLIVISSKNVFVKADYLFAVSSLLYEKKTAAEKRAICAAFQSHDIATLIKLGLTESNDAERFFSNMPGSIMSKKQQSVENPATMRDIPQNVENTATLSKIPQTVEFPAELLDMRHVFKAVYDGFSTKSEFIARFYDKNAGKTIQEMVLNLADSIYDENPASSPSEVIKRLMDFLHFGVSKIPHFVEFSTPVNNIEKENKKRNTQSEALVKEREEKDENIEEKIEDDGLTREERSQRRKNNFKQFRTVETVEMNQPIQTLRNLSGNSPRRKSWSYPMLPVDEVDRIISDVSYAASSSFKLFINTVWWTLYDSLQNSADIDEDDEELSEEDFNIEGYGYPTEDFQHEILEVAYEEVEGYIEKGCVELDEGDSVPVTFTEMFPVELIDKIFKWEQTDLTHQESVYKISKTGIFDVTAEKVEKANQPQSREEKRAAVKDSLEYMTKLYIIRQTDNKYLRQLTPIEKLAADFIANYMKPEEREDDPILRFSADMEKENVTDEGAVNKWGWKRLLFQVGEAGYTEQEFLSCLLSNKGPTQYEQLIIQPCMFFAEGIRTLNKIHGNESVIDSITIETLRNEK